MFLLNQKASPKDVGEDYVFNPDPTELVSGHRAVS